MTGLLLTVDAVSRELGWTTKRVRQISTRANVNPISFNEKKNFWTHDQVEQLKQFAATHTKRTRGPNRKQL